MTEWNNLLLGCKYCNTRKSKKTDSNNVSDYLWPDKYNTSLAFSYEYGKPSVDSIRLMKTDPSGEAEAKAQNLYQLVGLGNVQKPGEKDRRFGERMKAYELALDSLESYNKVK